jgi:NTE family protein
MTLILEGGGVKGIAHVGALKALHDIGMNFSQISGSSAGSQAAALLAAGYTIEEMKEIIENMPFDRYLDSSFGIFRDFYRLFTRYGYYKGEYMETYMDKLLEDKLGKKQVSFKDLYDKTQIHLKITGTCLTTKCLEWFDYKNTPDMPVCKAVHISSCIPLFYMPVTYDNKVYVDGGCLRNLPLDAFDDENIIALDFEDEENCKINSLYSFIQSLLVTLLTRTIHKSNVTRVDIPTGDIKATDFQISKQDKQFLYMCGYEATRKTFRTPSP